MGTFSVLIEETLERTVQVEADDEQSAVAIVTDGWKNEVYTLDSSDFQGVEVTIDEG